ncbi:5-methyltetrahydrofolate--homocysteine methyltransferase [Dysgonomonas sp. PH5-45]|nr:MULTISPECIES: methionine synthase [unclassified Dysgonomonas]MDH6354808.1 5-methyltetrahydrofolate--homocysteine methyltransferase [Dysgonomonas sp. PH5-45]MDH6387707.1 5-methyltetrahydrofolate--homocysteine methyltransferase [Dysgonomonas sp. PH5-37]
MKHNIREILNERILILDGAMGSLIQEYKLSEEDFRGERFKDVVILQKGNNDLLCLTRPDVIEAIHVKYLDAGADIIETNSFNANAISLEDYDMVPLAKEINIAAARIARQAADRYTAQNPGKPRFVAGSIGPTNKTTSMSPRVEDPMYRAVNYDDMRHAYKEQIEGLIEGGVDLLLVETIFDTLNAKAALFAAEEVMAERGIDIPVMISVTLSDKAGRTLSGQTIGAFLASVSHINYLSVGLNCSFGASDMKPFLKEIGRLSPSFISAYPNAGLPNQFGEYDETPEIMARQIKEYIDEGLVNILGGCCGTTPAHIARYVSLVEGAVPHKPAEKPCYMWLSGLELLEAKPEINFINVGERCNVAGSRKFLRLIKEEKYEEALSIAQKQVEDGAQILDVNMDEGLLDGVREMTNFLNLMSSDPDVSRVPVMIDSSKWEVIEAGLKCVQGKAVVNSISLKNGEAEFLHHARLIRRYGAAVIVMAFDEVGQADTYQRRIEICGRAYKLLVDDGFNPMDIVFDPNVLAIATGIEEHRNYAVDFLRTIEWVKANLPHAKISGGVSNLSFSFRGNDYIREVMHSVFLYHAIQRGMDMGIVNPGQSIIYDDIPVDLRNLVEDVVLNRREEATDQLIEYAERIKNEKSNQGEGKVEEWRSFPLDQRIEYALVKGISDYLEEDMQEALAAYPRAVDIIDKPLMAGMNKVGDLFGSGKMFLPQVVKTARTMKRAVSILQPTIEAQKDSSSGSNSAGKLVIATVKGDVHDIGKNIVSIILACNNYEVIDLGVMVPPEVIIQRVKEEKPDILCLSGLITPSLEEMSIVAHEMEKVGFTIPLMIGGATTSKLHTAIKIAPKYNNGSVVYVKDASQAPAAVAKLISSTQRGEYVKQIKEEYQVLRDSMADKKVELLPLQEAINNSLKIDWSAYQPPKPQVAGRQVIPHIPLEEIIPFIDWKFFFHSWNLSARYASVQGLHDCPGCKAEWVNSFPETEREKAAEGMRLYEDAKAMLHRLAYEKADYVKAVFGIYKAYAEDESVYVDGIRFPMLRQQKKNETDTCLSLCDFVAPRDSGKTDYVGAFTVTAGVGANELFAQYERQGDEYNVLLLKSVLDRLAEAATEYIHAQIRKKYWGFAPDEDLTVSEMFALKYQGIRPAVGYPSMPDQSVNFLLNNDLLHSADIGVELTENGVMLPNASVSGLIFAHLQAKYFTVGKISEQQAESYIERRGIDDAAMRKFLATNLI